MISLGENLESHLWQPSMIILEQYSPIKILGFTGKGLYVSNKNYKEEYAVMIMYKIFQVTIQCPEMNFDYFPLDSQICHLRIGDMRLNDQRNLQYWLEGFQFNANAHLNIIDYEPKVEELQESLQFISLVGNVTMKVAGLTIHLKRNSKYYILNYFLPSGLLTTFSCVSYELLISATAYSEYFFFQLSFVIPTESPARIGLLITLTLCLINMMISINVRSPRTQSINALSTWMIFCIVFVASALSQYGLMMIFRQWTQVSAKTQDWFKKIDLIFLIVFLVVFIIFNFVYWNKYLK